jgi:MFS family permease
MRCERSLDALNFFLADVRQGLGPYLAIYLLTERQWTEDQTGFVMSIAVLAGLVVQAPAGALIDVSHAKRAIIAGAALVVTFASIILPFMSSFVFVAGSQAAAGMAEALFAPSIAAITLGISGRKTIRVVLAAMKRSTIQGISGNRSLNAGESFRDASEIISRKLPRSRP